VTAASASHVRTGHERWCRVGVTVTICTLSSFGSSSVWQTALTQTFQRLWTRPKDARFCAIKPRKALREIETRGQQRFGSVSLQIRYPL
jgi:hypothetical protein